MPRTTSAARAGDLCLEANLAALMTSEGVSEARLVRADLRRFPLSELDPDPREASVPVDDKPNPFNTPPMADRYLRGLSSPGDVTHLTVPGPGSWQQHVNYATARVFRVVSEAGADALPGLVVLGNGDGLDDSERSERIKVCLGDRQPFAAIDPIDGVTSFLAIDSEDLYACVAIVVLSLQHVAIGVATGSKVALGTHDMALIRLGDGSWIPVNTLREMPGLHASVLAPCIKPNPRSQLRPILLGPVDSGKASNPMLLNSVVLGGVEAGYQPSCRPWDAAAMYIAAAAGRMVGPAKTGKFFTHPHQVQASLISALLKGRHVPGLMVARHELAARRLLTYLRQCGIA